MRSSFLDDIAAALIGRAIAGVVFRGKVHSGSLAAIVAASDAGGAGSVVGDTTTTTTWITPRGTLRWGVGLVSAAFDNIPLTALALKQRGYD